jgi:hypothetical protein
MAVGHNASVSGNHTRAPLIPPLQALVHTNRGVSEDLASKIKLPNSHKNQKRGNVQAQVEHNKHDNPDADSDKEDDDGGSDTESTGASISESEDDLDSSAEEDQELLFMYYR